MKSPNGFGSVYKLSGRRRRPWVARITSSKEMVRTSEGKEIARQGKKYVGYFETKTEALDALSMNRFNPIAPKGNITLHELYDEWSAVHYPRIGKTTQETYEAAWKNISRYKDVKFKELRTSHLQGVIDGLAGKSRSKLEKVKNLCILLYKYGLENDVVTKNYAEFLRLPKEDREEREIFSDLDIKKLQEKAGVPWVDTILIMIYTGLRITELLTLTKFNVDMEKQIITGGIKTEAGKNRVIPIHPKILPHIKRWYDKNGETLICTEKGKQLSARYYREKKYYPALETVGVKKLTPHACRHTFASLLARAKADPLYIKQLIGHSDYAFTANTYTHTQIQDLKNAVAMI